MQLIAHFVQYGRIISKWKDGELLPFTVHLRLHMYYAVHSMLMQYFRPYVCQPKNVIDENST